MICPKCKNDNVARFLYGMPAFDKKLEKDMADGKVVLGGCEVDPLFPKYKCNVCKYEFSGKEEYADNDFEKIVKPVIETYVKKFGCGLPDDFDLRLDDADNSDECVRTIQKAIDDSNPFEDEGLITVIDDAELYELEKELGL